MYFFLQSKEQPFLVASITVFSHATHSEVWSSFHSFDIVDIFFPTAGGNIWCYKYLWLTYSCFLQKLKQRPWNVGDILVLCLLCANQIFGIFPCINNDRAMVERVEHQPLNLVALIAVSVSQCHWKLKLKKKNKEIVWMSYTPQRSEQKTYIKQFWELFAEERRCTLRDSRYFLV